MMELLAELLVAQGRNDSDSQSDINQIILAKLGAIGKHLDSRK